MKKIFCVLLSAALALPVFLFAGCDGGAGERCAYDISAVYGDGVLEGEMDFTYVNNTGGEMRFLEFCLFGNAYREDSAYKPVSSAFSAAYYAGESYGSMEVLSVSPAASWEVCGADENILRAELASPVSPGEKSVITVGWRLTLANVNHRTGVAQHAVNLGNFYPVLCVCEDGAFYECEYYSDGDPFYSECADYSVTFTAPAGYTLAASGQIVSADADGANKIYEMRLENARDFAVVLSEEFSVAQCEAGGVQLMYYYYDDADADARLALMEKCLTYYSDTFGAYPYPTYSAVQTGFAVGGMEYPALVMLGDHITGTDYDYTLVHETAHQWWYAAVGNNQLENAWQDEGLAEFSAALFFEDHAEYGLKYASLKDSAERAYRALYTVQSQIFGEADTAMNKKLGEYLSEYQYVVLSYDKGFLLFDTLRESMGEKKFMGCLRRYFRENSGKLAQTDDLIGSFAGAEGVIRSFIDGTAVL